MGQSAGPTERERTKEGGERKNLEEDYRHERVTWVNKGEGEDEC